MARNVTSRVVINRMRIRQLSEAQIAALEKTAEALHTEIVQAQVIPRDEGTLQNEGTFVNYSDSRNGHVSIVSMTPYARRLYFHPEYRFNKVENPNAKGKWFEDWLPGGKEENYAKDKFREFYRREAGL